jgi:hypothetical protein
LGTGKLDLQKINQLAKEMAVSGSTQSTDLAT